MILLVYFRSANDSYAKGKKNVYKYFFLVLPCSCKTSDRKKKKNLACEDQYIQMN